MTEVFVAQPLAWPGSAKETVIVIKADIKRVQKGSVSPMSCPDVAENMSRVADCDHLVSSRASGSVQGRSHVCPKPPVSLN